MVGEALGTKERYPIESSNIKGNEVTMNRGRDTKRRERKKLRTREQRKIKW